MAESSETPIEALVQSFLMIVVSEIGDKTFLIACIMATRHPRLTVFGGAFSSLIVMSILSAALGRVILGLIPKVWTHYAASILFLLFGLRMLQEGLKIPSGQAHIQEEMREVEDELEEEELAMDLDGRAKTQTISHLIDAEEGHAHSTSTRPGSPGPDISLAPINKTIGLAIGRTKTPVTISPARYNSSHAHPLSAPRKDSRGRSGSLSLSPGQAKKWKNSARNFCALFSSPAFAQAFILTFLGEWGDRSQIATIALGGANSVAVVAFGTILGHGVCTFGAVMGGRYLSTKISIRHITLMGSCAFLIFSVIYLYEAWTGQADEEELGMALGGMGGLYR